MKQVATSVLNSFFNLLISPAFKIAFLSDDLPVFKYPTPGIIIPFGYTILGV